ncbi:MAG: S9 family peptidase [Proteobacteria bacterium]|nr:S9 family peptidase [Pseudomonadota bacterium]
MRPIEIEDLFRGERLVDVSLSPSGQWAWLTAKRIDLGENTSETIHYLLNCHTGDITQRELHPKGASGIVFSSDGDKIFFAADGQIHLAEALGEGVRCLTKGRGGASQPLPSADAGRVLFVRQVYENPELQALTESETPTMAQTYQLPHPKARARTASSLMYRHWDKWTENSRSHLFLADVATGECVDLTPHCTDVPPIALAGQRDFDFSPDGRHVAFAMNPDKDIARSTNNSIYLLELDGLTPVGEARRISTTNGCDTQPRFLSATKLAYTSMLTPGYEADATRLKVFHLNTSATDLYLETFDRSVDTFFGIDADRILFSAQDFAHISLYRLDLRTQALEQLTAGKTYLSFAASPGAECILAVTQSLTQPSECVALSDFQPFEPHLRGPEITSCETVRQYTRFSEALSGIEMHPGTPLWYEAADGTPLQGYVVLPPGYDVAKRYPLILLIHGGPQGAFLDSFHYRWNVQAFASRGAVVAFCNPRGSTGYGHQITRDISTQWSDACPDDIMRFLDATLAAYPTIDPTRLSAAGASFGGYMVNWLLGHTDRFRALVSHDGIFNTEMAGYLTDELWFSEHEFGGKPHECPEQYLRHSPHRFVSNFKTPTLVVQGEQDFRCVLSEGLALFTALQYQGVESRLLYFPDEGHWVLTPANAFVWYSEVLDWLMNHM